MLIFFSHSRDLISSPPDTAMPHHIGMEIHSRSCLDSAYIRSTQDVARCDAGRLSCGFLSARMAHVEQYITFYQYIFPMFILYDP